MSDELRERVRNKVASRAGCKTPCRMSVLDCACLNTTDAAIALIRAETLEEAAAPKFLRPLVEEQSKGEWDDKTIDEDVAMFSAAIRAMKGKP